MVTSHILPGSRAHCRGLPLCPGQHPQARGKAQGPRTAPTSLGQAAVPWDRAHSKTSAPPSSTKCASIGFKVLLSQELHKKGQCPLANHTSQGRANARPLPRPGTRILSTKVLVEEGHPICSKDTPTSLTPGRVEWDRATQPATTSLPCVTSTPIHSFPLRPPASGFKAQVEWAAAQGRDLQGTGAGLSQPSPHLPFTCSWAPYSYDPFPPRCRGNEYHNPAGDVSQPRPAQYETYFFFQILKLLLENKIAVGDHSEPVSHTHPWVSS